MDAPLTEAPLAEAPLAEAPEMVSGAAVRCITPDSVSVSAEGGCLNIEGIRTREKKLGGNGIQNTVATKFPV